MITINYLSPTHLLGGIMTYLSHSDVAELRRQRENAEQFNLTERWLEQLVVRRHRLVSNVVVACNSSDLAHLVTKERYITFYDKPNVNLTKSDRLPLHHESWGGLYTQRKIWLLIIVYGKDYTFISWT